MLRGLHDVSGAAHPDTLHALLVAGKERWAAGDRGAAVSPPPREGGEQLSAGMGSLQVSEAHDPASRPAPPRPQREEQDMNELNFDDCDEDDDGANMYSLERKGSRCEGIDLKRLGRTKSLDKCVKNVKERGGLYFAYRTSNGVCYEQPKPWSECRRIKRGPYDFYNMKAEPALGHAEPALGHAHEREISMLYAALTIGTCAMAFIAVRVHRRAKRRTNIDESRTLDPRDKISYGAVV